MWRRVDLKDRAKWVMKNCYWKAVLISLVLAIITGGSYGSSRVSVTRRININSGYGSNSRYLYNEAERWFPLIGAMFIFFAIFAIVAIVLGIFVFRPLEVGARRFFIISRVQPADLNEIGFCFKNSYMNVVKVQFLRGLFTSLWSLLFIIPGIIKAYEYRMIPYILAENPGIDYSEAFQISKDMMYGEKWDTFVLDLSFIGWSLLSVFTCGLLAVFYVNPYVNLTNAELYDVLKQKLFGSGSGATNGQGADMYGQNNAYGQNTNTYGQNPNTYGQNNAYGQNPNTYGQNNAYGQNSNMYGQNNAYGQNSNIYGQNNVYGQNPNTYGQNDIYGQNLNDTDNTDKK